MSASLTNFPKGHNSKYHFHTIPVGESRFYATEDTHNVANCAYGWARLNRKRVRTKKHPLGLTVWRIA